MTPSEIALAVFFVLFILVSFVLIYLILTGLLFASNNGGSTNPTGSTGSTGATGFTGPCNPNLLSSNTDCCYTGRSCSTSQLLFCQNGMCSCTVTGTILCESAGFGSTPACVFPTSITNCGGCGIVCTGGT